MVWTKSIHTAKLTYIHERSELRPAYSSHAPIPFLIFVFLCIHSNEVNSEFVEVVTNLSKWPMMTNFVG